MSYCLFAAIVNNTSVISTEPTLSLTNISSLINGGTYYSIVVNDAGYEITPRSIYFLPRFLRQPEDVFADVNDSVAFTVEVDGSPFPNIQWQRLVDDNFENLPGKNQTILLFESVDFSDAGIYRSVISITINSTEYTVNSTEVALAGIFIIIIVKNNYKKLYCNFCPYLYSLA